MRRKILPFVLGGALSIAAIAPAAAAPPTGFAGAAGLVNVVVQAILDDVDVDLLNNSLNDLTITVDIDDTLNNALQNVLQNARILNGLEVTIENVLNDLVVNLEDIEIEVAEGGIVVNVLSAGGIVDTITLS